MAFNSASLEKTGAWYGFLNGLALIAYGLVLQLLGLQNVAILRGGFLIIGVIFICMAIASYKKGVNGRINYLQGLGAGTIASIIGTILFAIFTVINISVFGSDINKVLGEEYLQGSEISVGTIFMLITMVGVAGGFITSFIAMQYFKRPDHKLSN